MNYKDIENPKIKAVIDGLKYQSYSVMIDVQQAFDEAGNETEFIEDAMANMENMLNEILEIKDQIQKAGEV